MRSDCAQYVMDRRLALEKALFKILSDFEDETGLSVTDIDLIRPDVGGGTAPISQLRTTVELIAG